ncbi:GerMN domain-containing protein [Sediminispirochaeta bajacaliforniensis]|uniref:GerMN domain-containing protein n=1 Tax=Sediminispirochaeta bajacaliforniensis TaxID=148 RepID=UPI00037ADCAC|nr:GerMN domain-containing protein [Sediminispirochaeta bajacaliforniensis]
MARKKNSSLGCLFWIALILLALVIFLFSRERISSVLETTGFDTLLKTVQKDTKEPEVKRISPEEEKPPAEERPTIEPSDQVQERPKEPEVIEKELPVENLDEPEQEKPAEKPLVEQKLRTSILYFVMVGDSGEIALQHVTRPVYYESSPLTRTLEALLKGLTTAELNKGMISLIPEGTALRSVMVRNGVAYVDFSETFAFNEFGVEGANAALKQVVYTATEFSTVKSVQITINGKKKDYIATEGLTIANPIGRDSFK